MLAESGAPRAGERSSLVWCVRYWHQDFTLGQGRVDNLLLVIGSCHTSPYLNGVTVSVALVSALQRSLGPLPHTTCPRS